MDCQAKVTGMTPAQKTALENVRFTVDTARNTGLSRDEIIKAIEEPVLVDQLQASENELSAPAKKA